MQSNEMATMGSRVNPQSVCVIGSGVLGLVATKNLVEQGLEVQILEKNGYIGGIWHVTEDIRQTSALSGTRAQFSKLRVFKPNHLTHAIKIETLETANAMALN